MDPGFIRRFPRWGDTAAIDTPHLSRTVTHSMADAEHLHVLQVVQLAQR